MKKQTKILSALAVLWMVLIFLLSGQSREVSSEISDDVTAVVVDVMYGDKKPKTVEEAGWQWEEEAVADMLDKGLVPGDDIFGRNRFAFKNDIRKLAHIVLYLVLAVLLNVAFISHFGRNKVPNVLASLAICAVYACLDELHQMFVPGRGASVKDVLIDCAGAAAGVAAVLLVYALLKLIKRIIRGNGTTA